MNIQCENLSPHYRTLAAKGKKATVRPIQNNSKILQNHQNEFTVNHSWRLSFSSSIRCFGSICRQQRIKSQHSFDKPSLLQVLLLILRRSRLFGKSPHSITNMRIPSDHTVAGFPWYLPVVRYSGGQYSLVPGEQILFPSTQYFT